MNARDDRYWNRATQTAPREVLDQMHLKRIQRLVALAYERSPLHRRLYDDAGIEPSDIRTWDDYYHRLPFTDKGDYMVDQERHGYGGLALEQRDWQQYFHTSGTTGRFMNEVMTHYDMHKAGSQYCYGLWDCGIRRTDSMFFCFDFGMWIGLWSFYWGARNLGLTIISGGGLSGRDRVRKIMELRPTIVCGTPTYLLHLADIAQAEGIDIREAGVQMLAGGGEAGFAIPLTRRKLAEAWGTDRIYDAYGVGEALFIAQSCREWAGGVHLIEDVCHAYAADPDTGEPISDPDAVGENVITSYTRLAQPFIKYRTHDLVRLDLNPEHGCGWTWGHYRGSVLGRTDFMVTIRGVNVFPTAVENLIGEIAGFSGHYELHISRREGMDRMLIKVESAFDDADRDFLNHRLAAHVYTHLGVNLEVEVLAPGTLPRYQLKTKRIFDHREPADRPQITFGGKA
ncbi:phenylacetate-coenzyme A ligase [Mycobacterium saskatchewanense]|uniref:AMP-binding enzyme family protein n=2 Tax=Mycobacterium TaxID=1763 RepID=X8CN77_MYCIT|nr:AMP-binding protein [Mycobacterium saskatchewanense]EUA56913.1 AMP-binding enzyme family protein [Mycobacterium intracellulare 1956]ORW74638.1 CoA ligase [Mycobacterium saskatchewanense]BBX65337.1 phenylacetate-coenzyme A ligase [Mycobacterium saskatchewanense]